MHKTLFFLVMLAHVLFAQEAEIAATTSSDSMRHIWRAFWITHPAESGFDYGVFHFRRTFDLQSVPDSFVVYVSADNRYRLFVNGDGICEGPARDDLHHWPYDTIDLAPYLKSGKNVIAAQVVNYGEFRSGGQFSEQTAFILQTKHEPLLDSNAEWKVMKNHAVQANPITPESFPEYYPVLGFYAGGPCDSLYADKYPWGWQQPDYDDSNCPDARQIRKGAGRGFAYGNVWFLVPRQIKMMEEEPQQIGSVERSDIQVDADFLAGKKKIEIPANQTVSILFDNETLTMGYPELTFSGGRGSRIKMTYAESLYDKDFLKGDRNATDGKNIYGIYDVFIPDGGEARLFRTTWIRAFRYVQLDITTRDEPLTLDKFEHIFTAYPLREKASFQSDDPSLEKIWETSWRSLRLCGRETFFSDAYFEQMQYIGDTRVQALASMIVSGDESLFRNALRQFDASRLPNGLTQSRYPARELQIIPTYSLLYIAMLHDYMMYRGDAEFLHQFLPGVKSILAWFENHVAEDGLLGPLDWWNFCDWAEDFKVGIPPGADEGGSTLVTLTYVYGLQKAAELLDYCGYADDAEKYKQDARALQESVRDLTFDPSRGLYADTPLLEQFSQHTNIFAVITDTHPREKQTDLMHKVIEKSSLTQTTFYFKFYLFEALAHVGLGDIFIQQLDPWRKFIDLGLTTFPEDDSEQPRSDCHPWSASPCYYLLNLTAGVKPAEPGFGSVIIQPNFGGLEKIEAVYPHPKGEIKINLSKADGGTINMPENLFGVFKWKEKSTRLVPGKNTIKY
jgi:hypothetical protein